MKSRIATLIALATTAVGLGCGGDDKYEGVIVEPPSPDCTTIVSDDPTGGLPLEGDCNSPFYDMFMSPISKTSSFPTGVFHFHRTCVLGFYDRNIGGAEYNDAPPGFVYENRDPKTTYQGIDVKNFPVPEAGFTIDATFKKMVTTCEPRHHTQTRTTEEVYFLKDLGFTLMSEDSFKRAYEL